VGLINLSRLAEEMDFGELKSTWKVMGEKGLRVHVDLEDAFDEMRALDGGDRKRIAYR
jgi:hypothetical protein